MNTTESSFIEKHFKPPRKFENGDVQATPAFGRVNFLGHSQTNYAPYVCISKNDDSENVFKLMKNYWKLDTGKLKLILSVTGGAVDLKLTHMQKAAIKNGIISVVTEAGGWITSGGTDTGIMKICGEAVAEYRKLNHDEDFVLIGIATWRKINNNSLLIRKNSRSWQCYSKDQNQKLPGPDFNHTHFIFVDNEEDDNFGVEIDMRTSIEETFVKETNCQCVCLVVEGGIGTVKTTRSSLKKKIPVVILEGSGRFADVLAWAYNEYSKVADLDINDIKTAIMRRISKWCAPGDKEDCCTCIMECLDEKHRHLIFVQKLEPFNSESIFNTIMQAFVIGHYKNKPKEQLEATLKLNQLEIANQIFMTHALFDHDFLKTLLQTAIAKGQTAFIQLLTENGVQFCDLNEECIEHLNKNINSKLQCLLMTEISKYKDKFRTYAAVLTYLTIKKDINSLMVVLQNIDEPIASCLFICKICQELRGNKVTKDKGNFCGIDSVYNEFQNLAIDIIDKCYDVSDSNTYTILSTQSSFNKTVYQQGIRADCRKFMATEAVQSLFSAIWTGQLSYDKYGNICFATKFYCSPKNKCRLSILFALFFVVLFTLFIIKWYHVNKMSWMEFFIFTTVVAFMIEECKQCYSVNLFNYFTDSWNYVDIVGIIAFCIGFFIRFPLLIFGFEGTFVEIMMEVSLVAYWVSLISYYLKIMHACYFSSHLGPKIEMIKKMMYDLAFFLVILMIFLIGFGVTEYIILRVSTTTSIIKVYSSWREILNVVLVKPYFRLYGELFMDDLLTKNTGNNINILLIGIYMIFTNVLLLNMLIAMFGYTFSEVQSETDVYWKFYRFKFLYEYTNRPFLPGPLMLFSHVYLFTKWIYKQTFQSNSSNKRSYKDEALEKFEKERFKNVIWERHVQATNSIESKLSEVQLAVTKSTEEKLNEMKAAINKISNQLEKLLKDTQGVGR